MKDLFSMKGRINRQKYFVTSLIIAIVAYAVAFMIGFAMGMTGSSSSAAGTLGFVVGIAAAIVQGFLVVKRLHDLNKPSWQYWLLCIPLYNIYLGLVLLFVKGTAGTNEYGDDPLAA